MLDLLHLKTFVVVATTKSISRAAAELGYSQSSITHHIQMLERELGARLFDRFKFSRGVALTVPGMRIYHYAIKILRLAEKAKAALKSDRGNR